MALVPVGKLQPPANDKMLSADGQLAQPWQQYFQRVSDQTKSLSDSLHTGTTTSDDAEAGFVGEHISASFGPIGLSTTTPTDLGTINLTGGDWDVRGWATFTSGSNTLRVVQMWVNTAAATPFLPAGLTLPVGGIGSGTAMWWGPMRFAVAATTAVRLGVQATFTSSPASATGYIAARRAR